MEWRIYSTWVTLVFQTWYKIFMDTLYNWQCDNEKWLVHKLSTIYAHNLIMSIIKYWSTLNSHLSTLLAALHAAKRLHVKYVEFDIIFFNSSSYFKNYSIIIRLICTHLNSIFMLNLNMAKKIWIKKMRTIWKILACCLHSTPGVKIGASTNTWMYSISSETDN